MARHDWITFRLDLKKLPWSSWVELGECVAMCEQMRKVPLKPHIKEQLHLIYLAKGVHATTAIEGNTLSEEQVKAALESRLELPPSKEYLRQEVDNIVTACNDIVTEISRGELAEISVAKLCHYNDRVLYGDIPRDPASQPGQIRRHNVVVGNVYRAPGARDVPELLDKFCGWMNGRDFIDAERPLHFTILKAITAHLYIAWIHPFGDGNGRVARLLEFATLLGCGVPSPAAHLLSNHYNATRSEYYRQLDRASKTGDPTDFFVYAITGLRDGLKEQLEQVERHVLDVCWRDYIYEAFAQAGFSTAVTKRRRELSLQISKFDVPVDKETIYILMRRYYSDRTERTLTRDLNELEEMQIIVEDQGGFTANTDLILQLRPFAKL
jgi:Fic family protein